MVIFHGSLFLGGISVFHQVKRAIRAILNLAVDAAVWFGMKNPNLEALIWPELEIHL